jgi:hypothetical protein
VTRIGSDDNLSRNPGNLLMRICSLHASDPPYPRYP